MKLKTIICSIGFSLTAIFSFPAANAQGVPVIDAAGLAQAILTVQNLQQQVQQQIEQIQRLDAQLASVSGSRGMGQLLNDPTLRAYLPEEWRDVYDTIKSGGSYGGGYFGDIYEGYELKTDNEEIANIYQVEAANKAMLIASYENTLKRLNNIQGLLSSVDATRDIKAAADLQNRIAIEQAVIQAEQIRINLMQNLANAEANEARDRARRTFVENYLK